MRPARVSGIVALALAAAIALDVAREARPAVPGGAPPAGAVRGAAKP